ncbi:MAG TPA: type II toxin-antitoxin system Phd/YefM family antitoxin [Chloroflexota bacterium]|jgi:prevent-host-death family protein|nr:type II toxin-antitoxin system Phd/YefM family antitoxin [Chloroflexota bacterium]
MVTVHGHKEPIIPAGEFKQHCLALLDQVSETGVSLLVTKRGRPVARVVPVETPGRGMRGSIRVLTDDDEELFSTGETWEVEAGA